METCSTAHKENRVLLMSHTEHHCKFQMLFLLFSVQIIYTGKPGRATEQNLALKSDNLSCNQVSCSCYTSFSLFLYRLGTKTRSHGGSMNYSTSWHESHGSNTAHYFLALRLSNSRRGHLLLAIPQFTATGNIYEAIVDMVICKRSSFLCHKYD